MTVSADAASGIPRKPSQVAIVTGSWKPPSKTRVLTEAFVEKLSEHWQISVVRVDLAEIGGRIAALTSREELAPETARLFSAVEDADLLVVGSPIFKASYTGLFKHFFDLISPTALTGTPVVLTATGGSDRHALALEHQFRPLFGFFDAPTLPTTIYAVESDFSEGALVSGAVHERIGRAVTEAVRALDRLSTNAPSKVAAAGTASANGAVFL
jgi:FMN reductase